MRRLAKRAGRYRRFVPALPKIGNSTGLIPQKCRLSSFGAAPRRIVGCLLPRWRLDGAVPCIAGVWPFLFHYGSLLLFHSLLQDKCQKGKHHRRREAELGHGLQGVQQLRDGAVRHRRKLLGEPQEQSAK